MPIIDSHLHFLAGDAALRSLPGALDVKMLNICVARDGWRMAQAAPYQRQTAADPEHFAWCTTFDLPTFDEPDYASRVVAQIDEDFAAGAVACKIWKNIGIQLKSPAGHFILPDDPLFDPIYAHLAARGWTLLAHIAEPLACWQPLDSASPHYGYYKNNPQWHMFQRTDVPSHQTLMAARDHIMAKHPTLRLVGAHLGSLEYSLTALTERFERFPNFAVDTSARLGDLARHPAAALRAFLTQFQDRVLWGTDIVVSAENAAQRPADVAQSTRHIYATERAFYTGAAPVQINNRPAQGLNLPGDIIEKLFYGNALRWYPRLIESQASDSPGQPLAG